MQDCAWVYNHERVASIHSEIDVQHLAEQFPEAIYFFYDSVEHPNFSSTKQWADSKLEYHDEFTMQKVREALLVTGMPPHKAQELITSMQNYGILFRERV